VHPGVDQAGRDDADRAVQLVEKVLDLAVALGGLDEELGRPPDDVRPLS
jgi:hypothetical protein